MEEDNVLTFKSVSVTMAIYRGGQSTEPKVLKLMERICTFQETINSVFKTQWKETGTKANKDALALSTELMRIFTVEAVHRAVDEANKDAGGGSQTLQVEHLEKVLPQLMLDF